MIKLLNTAIIVSALILIPVDQSFYSLNAGDDDRVDAVDNLPNDLNVHYTGNYCLSCHEKTPEENGNKYLNFDGDYNRLCKCHVDSPGNYIHPVGIEPSKGKQSKIPSNFPLLNGELWCNTCHNIKLQCISTNKANSLRGAPFENRTEFCFNCHNETNYVMQDIHKHINTYIH